MKAASKLQGVPHLHENHKHGFHYQGFWLIYLQVGDFCISRGSPTFPITQILRNSFFFKAQNPLKLGTLCTSIKIWNLLDPDRLGPSDLKNVKTSIFTVNFFFYITNQWNFFENNFIKQLSFMCF